MFTNRGTPSIPQPSGHHLGVPGIQGIHTAHPWPLILATGEQVREPSRVGEGGMCFFTASDWWLVDCSIMVTLREINIDPAKWGLEDQFPIDQFLGSMFQAGHWLVRPHYLFHAGKLKQTWLGHVGINQRLPLLTNPCWTAWRHLHTFKLDEPWGKFIHPCKN